MTNEELGSRIESLLLEMRRVRILMEHQVLPGKQWGHHSCPVCHQQEALEDEERPAIHTYESFRAQMKAEGK